MLPHSFATRARGLAQGQAIRFEKIELNVPIDALRFRMPVAKKPEDHAPSAPTPAASSAPKTTPARRGG